MVSRLVISLVISTCAERVLCPNPLTPGFVSAAASYVKGHNPKDYFGIYDVVRFDTFWLDKA